LLEAVGQTDDQARNADGHGHNYNDTFVDGWSVIAPVDGWALEHAAQLQQHLLATDPPGL
jgi:uncharacterized membrane protein